MDQKDVAFVFLSLIIVYSFAFQTALESAEYQDTTSNIAIDPNDMKNNTNHNTRIYSILSTLPAIASPNDNNPSSAPQLHTNHESKTATDDSNTQNRSHNSLNIENRIKSMDPHDSDAEITQTPLLLIEPRIKAARSTVSDTQHHIVEYHALKQSVSLPNSKEIAGNTLLTTLNNANLLITTVDGKFSVLSAEHGSKQMSIDSSTQLYQSPDTAYDNKIIPGIDGQLYILRTNLENEEYLEPLAFTVEQIAKNTGYADSFNTWYLVNPTNTVFWIDSDAWNVCKPAGNIPDITDDNEASDDVPACNNALIVTRIDRQITAVDVNSDTPSTQWRFKHGEYRMAAKPKQRKEGLYKNDIPPLDLHRFQLWQSLDEANKYTLFLYDRHIGEIKWVSKSLSSIVTNVKLLSNDHEIFNFYVHHTKTAKGLIEGHQDIGLWVVPSEDKRTQIAIAHSNRNPISNHMFLPNTADNAASSGYDADYETESMDDDEDDDDLHIIEEDVNEDDYNDDEQYSMRWKQRNRDRVRFVRLSFDGDLDKLTNIPSPAASSYPSWDSSLAHENRNNAQKYAGSSALKVFNPKLGLLAMDSSKTHFDYHHDDAINMEYYYDKHLLTISSIVLAALVLYLTPFRMPLRRLLFGEDSSTSYHCDIASETRDPIMLLNNDRKEENIDCDIKVIGKFSYNVKMKLGAGRRGHVFVGSFENRRVAIKRIDKMVCDIKVKNEIDILLKVDHQSNIVRYYATESDNEFDYIALDLCLCSLWDLIASDSKKAASNKEYKGRQIPKIDGITKPIISHEIHIDSLSVSGKHPSFCCCDSCQMLHRQKRKEFRPSNSKSQLNGYKNMYNKHIMNHSKWPRNKNANPLNGMKKNANPHKHLIRHKFVCDSIKKMMREMMDGILALHTAKDGCIIHRDIKPQNILIAKDCDSDEYKCKLADMGMAKLMDPARASFDSENCGTLFWNAPELIYHKSVKSNFKQIGNQKALTTITETHFVQNASISKKDSPAALLCSIFGDRCIKKEEEEESEYEESEYEYSTEEEEESDSYSSTEIEEESINEAQSQWISSSLTKKVDIFSLGCVFSFLLSRGCHPYGDRLVDQHENMEKKKANLKYCMIAVPQVYDLISWMINIDPSFRPQATECKQHPFFWSDVKIISFLNATSDYIEKCDKSHELMVSMQIASKDVIGNDWGLFVDAQLLSDAGKHRKYNFESMRDYLRLIRNKWAHFDELAIELKRKLSQNENINIKSASKFLYYFTQFCPKLVMFCYKLIGSQIKSDQDPQIKSFQQYFQQLSLFRIQAFNEEVRCNKFRKWYCKH